MFIPTLWVLMSTIEIPLTHGKTAMIDAEDYERISQYTWYAYKHSTNCWLLYAKINIRKPNGKLATLHLHQLIMNAQPKQQIDHINGNGLDFRKANIRFSTQQQNCWNRKKINRPCISRYKGVHLWCSKNG